MAGVTLRLLLLLLGATAAHCYGSPALAPAAGSSVRSGSDGGSSSRSMTLRVPPSCSAAGDCAIRISEALAKVANATGGGTVELVSGAVYRLHCEHAATLTGDTSWNAPRFAIRIERGRNVTLVAKPAVASATPKSAARLVLELGAQPCGAIGVTLSAGTQLSVRVFPIPVYHSPVPRSPACDAHLPLSCDCLRLG